MTLQHPSLALQLSFQMWTNQIQETLNAKKRGDAAFRARDFTTTIDCYTQVSELEMHDLVQITYTTFKLDAQ